MFLDHLNTSLRVLYTTISLFYTVFLPVLSSNIQRLYCNILGNENLDKKDARIRGSHTVASSKSMRRDCSRVQIA